MSDVDELLILLSDIREFFRYERQFSRKKMNKKMNHWVSEINDVVLNRLDLPRNPEYPDVVEKIIKEWKNGRNP